MFANVHSSVSISPLKWMKKLMRDLLDNFKMPGWQADRTVFKKWLGEREDILEPGLRPEPTIKVLLFLALLEAGKTCSYEDIRDIFQAKRVIQGHLTNNTLRTSMLTLGRTLEKAEHPLKLKSTRGRFQLIPRTKNETLACSKTYHESGIILFDSPEIEAREIACELIEKSKLSFHALYFLERSASWWE